MKKIKKAVFPVGGLGTRFLPATKALPKEMLPIANKPLIQHAYEEAVKAGIEQFIFITGRNKNIITNHFDSVYELERELEDAAKREALSQTRDWVPEPGNIAFIRQQKPLGLGHAVWCARNFIKEEPFVVLLADELFISERSNSLTAEMCELYNHKHGHIVAVADVAPKLTSQYGIVSIANDDGTVISIDDMVEKPAPEAAPSNTSIVGRYILNSSIFDYLAQTKSGSGGEIQLTDAIKAMIPTTPTYGYRFKGTRMDCGKPLGFLQANLEFAIIDPSMSDSAKELIKTTAERL